MLQTFAKTQVFTKFISNIARNAMLGRIDVSIVSGLKNLFGFLTILPIALEPTATMETVSKYFFLCPLVGLVIGIVAGLLGWFLQAILPQLLVGFSVLASLLILTGFQHFDGLLDFSDAVIVKGDPVTKVNVMHDQYTGAAAVAVGFITTILTGLSFGLFRGMQIIIAAIVSELTAKESMVLAAYLGKKPPYKGMGYYAVESIKNKHLNLLFSIVLSSLISYVLIGFTFVYVLAPMIILTLILTSYANRSLNGVSGDVLGAGNELCRMISLLALVAIRSTG